jgi:hypothetical protein
MSSSRSRWFWLVLVVVGVCLAASHWAAYKRGQSSEHQSGSSLMQEHLSGVEDDLLDRDLRYARLLARHTQDISNDERTRFCAMAEALVRNYETFHIARQRRLGNDIAVENGEQKLTELRTLLASLKRS